jgi:acetyltransferase-like isoleucine patch superfamily enzyme
VTRSSQGTGRFDAADLGALGDGAVLEEGVLIFKPEHVFIGRDVYIGHRAILKGDTRARLEIGDDSWIGQDCALFCAGGITLGRHVGMGPKSMILSAKHEELDFPVPIIDGAVTAAPVTIGDGADIGLGAIILPGVQIGPGAFVGAGAVVTRDVPAGAIVAGVPARVLRMRPGAPVPGDDGPATS